MKLPTEANEMLTSETTAIQKFLNTGVTRDTLIINIAKKIFRQEQEKPFLEKFIKYAGYPVWDKYLVSSSAASHLSTLAKAEREHYEKIIMIPLALENDSSVHSVLKVAISRKDTIFEMVYRHHYKTENNRKKEKNTNRKIALFFMGMEQRTFGHSFFLVNDKHLFKQDDSSRSFVKILKFNVPAENGAYFYLKPNICYAQWEIGYTGMMEYNEYPCESYNPWGDGEPGPHYDPKPGGGGSGWEVDPCSDGSCHIADELAWESGNMYYELSNNIIQNLQNSWTNDPIEFYLLAKYKSNNLLKLSNFAMGMNSFKVGDYLLTPNYNKNNILLFYSASRPKETPFLGIEYLIRADALQIFRDKIWLYTHAANMFYINGIPNEGQLQLASGDYLMGLATMWSDALTDPYYLVYLGNMFVCGAAGNSLKFQDIRNAAGEAVPFTTFESSAVLYENITKKGSTVNFKVGMKVVDFKVELSKVTGKSWEVNRSSNPRIEILSYKDLKYNFRDKATSGSPYTVDIIKNGENIAKYRFDN